MHLRGAQQDLRIQKYFAINGLITYLLGFIQFINFIS